MPPRPVPPAPVEVITRSTNLNQYIQNQTLSLRDIVAIGFEYRGYIVESVSVELGGIDIGTSMRLLVNGQIEDSVYMPNSYVTLYPRYGMQLDDEIQTLHLQVEGSVLINRIHVRLRPAAWNGGSGDWGQYRVPVDIHQILYDYDSLDLGQYFDLNAYNGHRLIAIEIDVESLYSPAVLSLLMNSFMSGDVQINGAGTVTLFPTQSAIIGQGADSLVLYMNNANGGGIDISTVTLRLSAY